MYKAGSSTNSVVQPVQRNGCCDEKNPYAKRNSATNSCGIPDVLIAIQIVIRLRSKGASCCTFKTTVYLGTQQVIAMGVLVMVHA